MIGKWLKRLALGLVGLVALALLAALLWWRAAGKDFLYDLILPDAARLLEGHEVPERLEAAAFREDLAFLARELPRRHVDYDRAFRPESVDTRVAELSAAAEDLSPARRALELVGLLALGGTGTGHTMIIPFQRALDWRIYPLSTYWFDDGLYVTAAGTGDQDAVGARILRIGGVPTAAAFERLAPYAPSDNPSSLKGNIPRLLAMAEPLIALGLAESDGRLRLELEGAGPGVLDVEPVSLTSFAGMGWARQTQTPADDAWSPADMRRRSQPWFLDYRPRSKTLYFQFNSVDNRDDETLEELARRLDETARRSEVERFIIDLRVNEGGNNQLARPLVETLSDHPVLDRPGVLHVLIGRRTFSAAANFASALERRTRATFVGETSGFAPDHYGDAVSVLLPGSKIVARVATRLWQEDLPGVGRAALEPDLPVRFLSRHHFAEEDVTLRAAEEHSADPPPAGGRRLPAGALGTYLLSAHHRVSLFEAEGRDRLAIDVVGRYAITDLHAAGETSWGTDIRDVTLELAEPRPATLWWKGQTFPLERVADDHRLPLELLEDGEIEAGVEGFRSAMAAVPLGSDFELALYRVGYKALRSGRPDDAVQIFALATELFPRSASSWDSLGDGLSETDDAAGAREAYRRALDLDALYDHARRRLTELGG